jgi:hypothetical protein
VSSRCSVRPHESVQHDARAYSLRFSLRPGVRSDAIPYPSSGVYVPYLASPLVSLDNATNVADVLPGGLIAAYRSRNSKFYSCVCRRAIAHADQSSVSSDKVSHNLRSSRVCVAPACSFRRV